MPPYRILVVDDSAFMRKFISDIVNSDEALTVVGTAKNGEEAIEAVKRLRPDAVTMDVEMPVMTGIEALPVLMREAPTPVVMLSSSTLEGAALTIRALELGAFDFVAKTSGSASPRNADRLKKALVSTLRAAVVDKKEEMIGKLQPAAPPPRKEPLPKPAAAKTPQAPAPPPARPSPLPSPAPSRPKPPLQRRSLPVRRIVAIGTSTGGPRALQQVLCELPEDVPAAILVVQHMPAKFTKSLADRLDTLCRIRVVEAEDGMEPAAGTVYIAPGGFHMTLCKEQGKIKLRLTEDPPRNGHRPSVDVMFESLLSFPELERTAVLMTGMGVDGAQGMKKLYEQGVLRTIAEDQSTCIVYGMPRAAVELGCVKHSVPLSNIAAQILNGLT